MLIREKVTEEFSDAQTTLILNASLQYPPFDIVTHGTQNNIK